jgi:hypothetical protein
MVNRYAIAISLVVILGWATPRADAANKEQRQTTWEGLSAVVGQKVKVVMPDGARIEGKATAVEVDALAVEIGKTSNKAAYPKGKFLVPRATLRAVDVDRPTVQWRIVGVVVGGGIGVLMVALAKAAGNSKLTGLQVVFSAGAVGVPVAGYFMGRAADRHTITYVIAQ